MTGLASRADLRDVSADAGDAEDRGAKIKARIDALGITDRQWHERTGIARQTLAKAIRNEPQVRPGTYTAIEAELDKMERAVSGEPVATQQKPPPAGVVRVTVEGVYGAKALIVEAPPENLAELEEMVDRIMRNLRGTDPGA